MIKGTVMECRLLKMEYGKGINMKVNLRMKDSMEKVLIPGQMGENLLVHG